jgi:cyclic beta-1,2-glucan synthetase
MFLIIVLEKTANLCEIGKMEAKAKEFRQKAQNLRSIIEKTTFFSDRYAMVILPDGKILGADGEFIDILPQAFAVFAGLKNADIAVKTAYDKLVDRENRVIRLLSPPFSEEDASKFGYIAAYPKGIRENGGQYTHAAVWLAMALFSIGERKKAMDLVDLINPMGYYDTVKAAESYRAEPFLLAGDVSYADGAVARAGWTHFTGSAAWFYRCIAENYPSIAVDGNVKEKSCNLKKCKVFDCYNHQKNIEKQTN